MPADRSNKWSGPAGTIRWEWRESLRREPCVWGAIRCVPVTSLTAPIGRSLTAVSFAACWSNHVAEERDVAVAQEVHQQRRPRRVRVESVVELGRQTPDLRQTRPGNGH